MLFTDVSAERVIRVFSKVGFRIVTRGKHVGMSDAPCVRIDVVAFRRDIIELSGPPRAVYYKSSAGKPLGKPGDRKTQRKIIEAGFELLQRDIKGMTIVEAPSRSMLPGMKY